MFETAGTLAIIEPILTLVGLVAIPLLWALYAASRAGRRPPSKLAGKLAIVGSATTLALAIHLSVRLALLPSGHVLVQHVAQLARLGQLDLAFDLALDARSATFAVIVALVACASVVFTTRDRLHESRHEPRLAWTGLVTTGAMLLCLGDSVPPIVVGLGILTLGAWGLSHGRDAAANSATFGGNLAVLLGFVFLFWSLGGAFGPEGYDPDGAPRFVLVTTKTPSVAPDKATLSMTTYAGALVSADDADLPSEPVVSPMSILVSPGVYTLRIQRGAASGDVVVPRVALTAGHTHVLTPYGPTTSLRVLDDQLAVPRLDAKGGTASVPAVLAGRTVGGLRASAVVLLLVIAGALGHVFALASRRGPSALVTVLEVLPAPYLALRLAPLVDPAGADGSLVVLLGAGAAIVLAARATGENDPHKALRGVLAATAAVAVCAAGLRDPACLVILVSSSILAAGAALAAVDGRHDVRWLGVACAAAVGLLPGAGTSVGFILVISAALGSAATGTVVWAAFAGAVALVLVATHVLLSLAAFRVYDTLISRASRDQSRADGAVVIVLAVLALGTGIVLGAGTTMFGGHVAPFVLRLSGGAVLVATRAMAGAAVVLTLVATTSGVVLARRTVDERAPSWLVSLGRPHAVLAWTANGVGEGAGFLEQSVRAMDRQVIEYVPASIAAAIARAARGFGRLISGKADPHLSRAADKLEIDASPRTGRVEGTGLERVHTAIVLVMVALVGLVVLSSLILG